MSNAINISLTQYDQRFEAQVVNLWNECLTSDLITLPIFRKQVLFDENFRQEFAFCAVDNNTLVGFGFGMKRIFPYLERGVEPEKSWINVVFVKESYRRKGIGTQLVKCIEEKLNDGLSKKITLASYSPNYFFPGVDRINYKGSREFFEYNGYQISGEAVSMSKSLFDYEVPQETIDKVNELAKVGYRFERFTYNYAFKLLEFLKNEFGGGWKQNALSLMKTNEAEDTILICIDKNDDVVGFCMRKMDGFPMRFGPFGVKAELRSFGLGGILFDLMQKEMKSQRLFDLYFLWTHGAGQRFYERHGVHVYREYDLMEKKFEE
ncbi:GNAT family N-acetyltransferase [Anaerorhabdus sp.]|uniref:GNAT family N-acetyltransferase n=1 Tax=Anaerorhabdus sp. TaxID=1872524 RepID=UPI002FC84AD9